MPPEVTGFFDERTSSISYVVVDNQTGRAAVIDPVLDYNPRSARISTRSADEIADFVARRGAKVDWILETHPHADHLSAAAYLTQRFGARLGIGEHIVDVQRMWLAIYNLNPEFATDGSQFDHLFRDGEHFQIGNLEGEVWHGPGHTPACVSYLVGDAAFVGDTLFMPDYGTARADFPGGDARQLYRSIKRVLSLPEATRIFVCHDYKAPGRDCYAWETTVGEQRRKNPHVRDGIDEEQFVKQRTAKDATLSAPTLLMPSIQVNMRAGQLPPSDATASTT
jgi:glyoxylase-like metal-dependent hydrolase (beta-lactamase superfamily II)